MLKQLILCSWILLTIISCNEKGKEKPCIPATLKKNIIGTWTGYLESMPTQKDEISFVENGTFSETEGILFGKRNEPVMVWKAEKDSLKISGKFNNNTSAVYVFSSLTNTCDSIVLDLQGIDKIFLKRKKD
ncbi:hypothetical protein [Dyadobacter sp. CY347]|uniref:hypothetical protein n=1 Tax=Dyadobacter sp. CY347 TaxID=2909336 RepID=UPI001F1F3FA3|nr:hypothetical protein [Dyadobacter sp. CY347]MCF2490303.1 hypothetical protein [Dyadobacter sp. CY347]